MRLIGADLHKKSITFCVVEVVAAKVHVVQRQRLLCKEVERIEKFLAASAPCELVVEATIGYEWFAGLAEKVAQRVVLAHAGKLRVIAESTRKTDKIDAYVLAEFLARDMIPEACDPRRGCGSTARWSVAAVKFKAESPRSRIRCVPC